MNYQEERELLIKEDQQFVTIPRPDYSKMTNEQIRKRTDYLKSTFEEAFNEDKSDDAQ